MTKRPSLRTAVPQAADEAAQAVAAARELRRQQDQPAPDDAWTTATIHLPAELLGALRQAAMRRSMRRIRGQINDGKNNRPSVSEMVVELLTRHRDELDGME